MKKKIIQTWLIASLCSVLPITYAAEPEDINFNSVDVYGEKHSSSRHDDHRNRTDEVRLIQDGNYNQATVDVSGKNNRVSLLQEGNRNQGDIQLDGNRNRISTSQVGNNLGFELKVEGNNQNYILTQKRR